jgi:hypothetical protein
MQGAAWISLLREIPLSHHDCLVFTISNGNEIVLQRLIRLDDNFMVAQGRLSGSSDQGMVMVLPYDQITHVSFNKKMNDAEIQMVIGGGKSEADAAVSIQTEKPQPAEATTTTTTPEAASSGQQAQPTAPKTAGLPAKSALLARLRERLATDMAKPANPNQ